VRVGGLGLYHAYNHERVATYDVRVEDGEIVLLVN
jgi:hypothetical protein